MYLKPYLVTQFPFVNKSAHVISTRALVDRTTRLQWSRCGHRILVILSVTHVPPVPTYISKHLHCNFCVVGGMIYACIASFARVCLKLWDTATYSCVTLTSSHAGLGPCYLHSSERSSDEYCRNSSNFISLQYWVWLHSEESSGQRKENINNPHRHLFTNENSRNVCNMLLNYQAYQCLITVPCWYKHSTL